METIKKLGIYLDHATANLIDFINNNNKESLTVVSDFDIQDKHETLQRSENKMHNKEQDRQRTYFKKIAVIAADFNELFLFGPTVAKTALLHFLEKDHNFDAIKMETENTYKMAIHKQ